MNENWSGQYYAKALGRAGGGELSAALGLVGAALGFAPADQQSWRLAGLCYYQLGNYYMAEHCLGQISDEWEDLRLAVRRKQQELESAAALAGQGDYKQAAAMLAATDKTVGGWTYLGCLYAVMGQREKAADCFLSALQMDHGNLSALEGLRGLGEMKTRKWWQIWR